MAHLASNQLHSKLVTWNSVYRNGGMSLRKSLKRNIIVLLSYSQHELVGQVLSSSSKMLDGSNLG